MLKKLCDVIKYWSKKDEFGKIIVISNIIGVLTSAILFFLIGFNQELLDIVKSRIVLFIIQIVIAIISYYYVAYACLTILRLFIEMKEYKRKK